jgi:hypothetical protein
MREGVSFSLSKPLTLGVKKRFTLRAFPDVPVDVERAITATPKGLIKCNLPALGVMSLVDAQELPPIILAGPAGGGPWEPMGPKRPCVMNCEYEGFVPRGLPPGTEFLFIMTLLGHPAHKHLKRVK